MGLTVHLVYHSDQAIQLISGGLQHNFPAGNSPNLCVSHHLEVNRTGATYILTWSVHQAFPPNIRWNNFYILVWWGYNLLRLCLRSLPPPGFEPWPHLWKADTMTIRAPRFTKSNDDAEKRNFHSTLGFSSCRICASKWMSTYKKSQYSNIQICHVHKHSDTNFIAIEITNH